MGMDLLVKPMLWSTQVFSVHTKKHYNSSSGIAWNLLNAFAAQQEQNKSMICIFLKQELPYTFYKFKTCLCFKELKLFVSEIIRVGNISGISNVIAPLPKHSKIMSQMSPSKRKITQLASKHAHKNVINSKYGFGFLRI